MKDTTTNFQSYRSLLNDKIALFSVNLSLANRYEEGKNVTCVHFSIPYTANESGLPNKDIYQEHLETLFRILIQLEALDDIFYAGHVINNGKTNIYFYSDDPSYLVESLAFFEQVEQIEQQFDHDWDIYYNFLLPSPLELNIHSTLENLEILQQQGEDLSLPHVIEHSFQFENEEDMYLFIQNNELTQLADFQIHYTEQPVYLEYQQQYLYLVMLKHKISLHDNAIFKLVEELDYLAYQHNGLYQSWKTIPSVHTKHIIH
ncbi:TIGR01619 family protein [Mergibacter septicus]|uniref:TIGR01619 family protein n=1 Tax=Mergibacter septicus TaxID=221402 RepID=A0A8D4J0W6_9PAST|nr:TIGR01619 family protein [Mergibacter septicus]AWX15964.1 TIGR01619 family protein [Mergibacter septicus]QDJ15217.1 TIGR01619 family protein [Mergibacter septicus]UTU47363.1 TIGR01619 family protein [Mergibacter septicus]WMR95457.1 TIGR01619 family protein [Mergibacter septicus]